MGPVAAFVKHLPVVVKGHAPAIRAGHAASKKSLKPKLPRKQPPHGGSVQPRDTPRRLHARHRVQPLRKPKAAVRPVTDAVHELMRVPDTKPRKEHTSDISMAVPVGILQVQQPVKVTDVQSARARLHPLHHGQSLRKPVRPVRPAITIRVLQNEYVIGARRTGQSLRVGRRTSHVQPPFFVPGKLNRLHHAIGLGGVKVHLVSVFHGKGRQLLLRCQRFFLRLGQGDRLRAIRRDRLAKRQRVNPFFGRLQKWQLPFERGFQCRQASTSPAVSLADAVTIDERPVRRPPTVEPQLVFADDLLAHTRRRSLGQIDT